MYFIASFTTYSATKEVSMTLPMTITLMTLLSITYAGVFFSVYGFTSVEMSARVDKQLLKCLTIRSVVCTLLVLGLFDFSINLM